MFKTVRRFGIALLVAALFLPAYSNAQNLQEWYEFEKAVSLAESTGKPLLIDVGAPWCGWCQKMKKEVYPDLDKELSRAYVFTRLNKDDKNSRIKFRGRELSPFDITRALGIQEIPAIVILNPDGTYVMHLTGYIRAANLEPPLKRIATTSE